MDQQQRPQMLEDIIEMQPGGLHGDRRRGASWWSQNWIAVSMFACTIFSQIWLGTDWLHARQTNEVVTAKDIEALRRELQAVPNLYVRQDVFTQVLVNINQRLASIDNKLERPTGRTR